MTQNHYARMAWERAKRRQASHFLDALAYGMGAATVHHGPAGPRYQRHAPEDMYQRPPLHGAIDFDRGADGIWRDPFETLSEAAAYYGFDMAQPGSDRTVYWWAPR